MANPMFRRSWPMINREKPGFRNLCTASPSKSEREQNEANLSISPSSTSLISKADKVNNRSPTFQMRIGSSISLFRGPETLRIISSCRHKQHALAWLLNLEFANMCRHLRLPSSFTKRITLSVGAWDSVFVSFNSSIFISPLLRVSHK